MHVVDVEASNANKRFAAMVQHTPLHTFLFNKHGKLLVANDAAMEACLHSTAGLKVSQGQDVTLKALFDLGSYPGQSRTPSCSALYAGLLFSVLFCWFCSILTCFVCLRSCAPLLAPHNHSELYSDCHAVLCSMCV